MDNPANAQCILSKYTGSTCSDQTAIPGKDYWYWLKAGNGAGYSTFSASASGWRALAAPSNVAASDNKHTDKIVVTWDGICEGHSYYYRVSRAEGRSDGAKTVVRNWDTEPSFEDHAVVGGVDYHYFVEAAVDAGGTRKSAYSSSDRGTVFMPIVPERVVISGATSLAAGGSANYTAKVVYSDGTSRSVTPTWTATGGRVTSAGTLTAPTISANTKVTLSASYTEDGKVATGALDVVVLTAAPSAPLTISASAGTRVDGIVVQWGPGAGATGYTLWRSAGTDSSSAEQIATVGNVTTYTDASATPGVDYTYWVKAVNNAGEGAFGNHSATGWRKLSAPTGVTASDGATMDKVLVSWRKVAGATHYRVSRATTVDGSRTPLGDWQTGLSYADTSASVGRTYYYFVTAAVDATGTRPSDISAVDSGVWEAPGMLVSIVISGPSRVEAAKTATYDCMAKYSDGTTKSVTPTWRVSGSANINAKGLLTASSVTKDDTATITATFADGSTKTATKSVKILAPQTASATVSNVRLSSRWPWNGWVDVDYTLVTSPADTLAFVSLSGRDHGLNRTIVAKTLSGDGATDAVAAGTRRISWNVGADYPGVTAPKFTVDVNVVPYTLPTVEPGEPVETVTVAFDAQEGTVSTADMDFVVGEKYGQLPIPTRDNYIFTGWWSSPTGGTKVASSTMVADTTAQTLYAQWVSPESVLTYTTNNSYATITGFKSGVSIADLAIPRSINGCVVAKIGSSAFYNNRGTGLTSVTIPSSVTGIENWAFRDCSGLTSVTIPSSVTSIGNGAFENCSRLTSVTIPSSVTSIGNYAFEDCSSLTSVTIPSSLTSIGYNPFNGCANVANVVVTGDSTLKIESILSDFYALTSITVSADNRLYSSVDGVLFNKDKTILIRYPKRKSGSYAIPSSVTSIGASAFSGCSGLTSVTIPSSVTSIGSSAFSGCSGLTSVTIPSSVTSIGSSAFKNCANLTSAVIMGDSAISTGYSGSFVDCPALKLIIVSTDNRSYSSVDGVLFNKDKTTLVCCPMGKSGSYTIPSSVTSIASYAFEDCSCLTGVTIPDSVTSIGSSAFSGCSGLTSVMIPSSVRYIESSTFFGCSGLTSVTIPSFVTSIGSEAFSDCTSLKSVVFEGNSELPIIADESYGGFTFGHCYALESITVSTNNHLYSSVDGVLFTKDKTTLIFCPRGKFGSYSIPDSVTSIGASAFSDCHGLTSVTIPDSVTSIGSGAFSFCENLMSVTIPDSVTSIGSEIFWGCYGLTSVTIPSSVTSIEDMALYECGNLASITVSTNNCTYSDNGGVLFDKAQTTLLFCPRGRRGAYAIPNSVTNIGSYAFSSCHGLTNVMIPNSVTSIEGGAFSGCGLTSVTIPNSVTSIGERVFSHCDDLRTIYLPSSLSSYESTVKEDNYWADVVYY